MSLQRALLLSIALHAVVLAIGRPQQPSAQKPNEPPLIARLVEARVEPVALQATPSPAPPRMLRKPTPSKQSPVLEQPAVESPTYPPEIAQHAIEEQAAVPEQALFAEQPAAAIFDPGAIARYRLEIISAARQFSRYPPIARENGWQGRAEVRVSFDGARQPALAISRSSGYSVLDRQAVETLSNALAPLPAMLLGRSFELEFPVVFSLED
jgi:periplasmic protein TonB